MKLTLLTATLTLAAASVVLADDPQLRTRLDLQRAEAARQSSPMTTIAVYANERGVGRSAAGEQRRETRFVLRYSPHGQIQGAYVPVK